LRLKKTTSFSLQEFAKMLQLGVMVQAYAAFLPACVTAYPLLKDAPDYVKFTIFGGLVSITIGLFAGILSTSSARRGLAIRLVSFSAIAVLTFCVASQLSSRTFISLTALVGVAVNVIVMLLRF
jgi:CHASE2 domain-containing sensor protein